jgi:hypothetical protein
MAHKIGDTVVIANEPAAACELCGKVDQLRPYGPNGERVCFECMMQDEASARAQFIKRFAHG